MVRESSTNKHNEMKTMLFPRLHGGGKAHVWGGCSSELSFPEPSPREDPQEEKSRGLGKWVGYRSSWKVQDRGPSHNRPCP